MANELSWLERLRGRRTKDIYLPSEYEMEADRAREAGKVARDYTKARRESGSLKALQQVGKSAAERRKAFDAENKKAAGY